MTTPNTITDLVTTLNLALFRDNPFSRVFELPAGVTPPTSVTSRLKTDSVGRLLSVQPTISISGQLISLSYTNTNALPSRCWHEVLFDQVIVWAGVVTVSKQTLSTVPAQAGVVLLQTSPSVSVQVAYSPPAISEGGGYEQHVAAGPLSGGRLVRLSPAGLVYYDVTVSNQAYSLLGVSLNAADAGGLVSVQTAGTIVHPGWGLVPGAIYLAGNDGLLVPGLPAGAAFTQIIGRAITANSLAFFPQSIIVQIN